MTGQLFDPGPADPDTLRARAVDRMYDELLAAVGDWLAASRSSQLAEREAAAARRRGNTTRARQSAGAARAALTATYERHRTELLRLEGRA